MTSFGLCPMLHAVLTPYLKKSPSLPLIGVSHLEESVMISREKEICSLESFGLWCSADRRAFRVFADTVSGSKVAFTKADTII